MGRTTGLVCVALVSAAIILYQVAITRVLSVVIWYHFAFLAISLAMLGLGAPGVWFSLARPRPRSLVHALLAGSVAVPLSVVVAVKLGAPAAPGAALAGRFAGPSPTDVLLISVAMLVPMLCLGGAVCLLLMEARGRLIGRMYGADLLGATVGALLVVPLLHRFPTPLLVAASGFLPLLAAVLGGARRSIVASVALALLACIVWGEPFTLRYTKTYEESGARAPVLEKWTPTARLTFFDNIFWVPDKEAGFAWGRGSKAQPVAVEQGWIEQDGCAGTPITRFDGDLDKLEYLLDDVTTVGHQLRTPRSVAIIGAGGGRDILTALLAGAERVDAVELNPHIVETVSTRFGEMTGDVYHLPGVNAVVEEGRSFLTRTRQRYDLIQIALTDSWTATAAGAFALSENYLYTREAFHLYWSRLSDAGLVSISRWFEGHRELEAARLLVLARAALADLGVEAPDDHLAAIASKGVVTVLVSRHPLHANDIEILDDVASRRGFVRHFPVHAGTPGGSAIASVMLHGPAQIELSGVDLSPPDDDRPFFFQMVPVLGRVDPVLLQTGSPNELSVVILRRLLVLVSLLTLALFFVPFLLSRRLRRHAGFWRGSGYFVAIGLAFMLVEAGLIQRFILYLGHPSYATTVVLAALLLGAGLGSIVAGRTPLARIQRLSHALPLLLALVNFVLAPTFAATLGLGFAVRVLVSVAFLLPAGFAMGFAFPAGMLRFGDGNKAWFWAQNGAASVLATVFSLAVAMLVGFALVVYLGVAAYLAAVLLLGRPERGARNSQNTQQGA
jgi:hypothetical protein